MKEVRLATAIQLEENGLTLWLKTQSAVIHVCGYLPAFIDFLSQQRDYSISCYLYFTAFNRIDELRLF